MYHEQELNVTLLDTPFSDIKMKQIGCTIFETLQILLSKKHFFFLFIGMSYKTEGYNVGNN